MLIYPYRHFHPWPVSYSDEDASEYRQGSSIPMLMWAWVRIGSHSKIFQESFVQYSCLSSQNSDIFFRFCLQFRSIVGTPTDQHQPADFTVLSNITHSHDLDVFCYPRNKSTHNLVRVCSVLQFFLLKVGSGSFCDPWWFIWFSVRHRMNTLFFIFS